MARDHEQDPMQGLTNSRTIIRLELRADLMTDFDHERDQGQMMTDVRAGLKRGIDDHYNHKTAKDRLW
jgi:hypothetical protein